MTFPLPFWCLHEAYEIGEPDAHGNAAPGWSEPVEVACLWWSLSSTEPTSAPIVSGRVNAEICLVVDSKVAVDHRDKFTIDGRRFDVIGLPKDYDHGPWGFTPNRKVVELRWVS